MANSYAGPTWITNGGTFNANVLGALPSTAADGFGGIATVRTTVIMDPVGAIPASSAPAPSTGSSVLNLVTNQAIQALISPDTTSVVNLNANTLLMGFAGAPMAPTTDPADFMGSITGVGGKLTKDGTNFQTLSGTVANTYDGVTTILGGTLDLNKTPGVNAIAGHITIGDGATTPGLDVLRLSASNQIINTSILTFFGTAGNAGTFRMFGNSETVGGLVSTADAGVVGNGNVGISILTLDVNTTDRDFSGILVDGVGMGGTLELVKKGTAQQTLSGTLANTFTGNTTITGGTLNLNKAGAIAIGGNITIGDGATTPGVDLLLLNGTGGNQIIDTSILTFFGTGGNAGTFRMNSRSEAVGGLVSTGNAGIVENGTAGTSTLTLDVNTTNRDFSGILQNGAAGTLVLTRTGTAEQTLSGTVANTFTGLTTVNAGVLNLNKTPGVNAIAANVTIGDGAGGASSDILRLLAANQIADASVMLINGSSGRFDLNNNNETVGSIADTGVVTPSGSSVTLGSATLTTGDNNNTTTFSGVVSGMGGNLIKEGTGTFTLAGPNTYTGTTNVNNGILRAANATALGTAAGNTVVATGTSLQVANGTALGAEPVVLNGFGFGGIGALTQDVNGTSSFAGPITVATNSSISTNGTGTFTLTGAIEKDATTLTLRGGGTIVISGGINGATAFSSDLVVDGTGAGGVTVVTIDTLPSSYAGPTWITNGGTLNANVVGALPSTVADGGIAAIRTTVIMDPTAAISGSPAPSPSTGSSKLNLGASQAIQSLTGANATSQVNLNANLLTIGTAAGTTTFAGSIVGAGGSITKDGASTQVLSGNSSYSGTTTLNAGVLGAGSSKALGNANLTVNAGTLMTVGGPFAVNIGAGNIAFPGGTIVTADASGSTAPTSPRISISMQR